MLIKVIAFICVMPSKYILQDINEKTAYQDFKRKWGADSRFEALDRKEREALFNEKYAHH